MIKCENCKFCEYFGSKGRPGKCFCLHKESPSCKAGTAGYTKICSTERNSKDFTIKRTPKWCPSDKTEKGEK